MDLMLEFNINGEILIPLENSNFLSGKKDITYKDLQECSYNQFRNVLFQGELIKFYILLKPDNIEPSKKKDFLENLFFKIDFESTGALNINEQIQTEDGPENTLNDLFTTNTEKINEKNYEYENVERKDYDEESQIEIYEVYKQIIVPKSFLNVQLIMKLQILKKNEDVIDFKENSDTYLYYKTGYFENVQKFKTLKTLFKEVKVIKPLGISETFQKDLTLELSLLQIKIDNITAQADYEDTSLKKSKYLKKSNSDEENQKFHFGNDIIINEIEILEDETIIDEKETEKVDLVKKYLMKKNSLMQNDMNFKLMIKNFPLTLRPGEDYSISVKVNKNSFLTDSEYKNNINDNSYQHDMSNQSSESLKTLGNILNPNSINTNLNLNSTINMTLSNMNNYNTNSNIKNSVAPQGIRTRKRLNSNAIVINRKSVFNQAQERLVSISNITNPLYTEAPMPINEIYQQTVGNKTEGGFLKAFSDENIKICYITPILLYISSKMFYENLFMCLQLKWYQDLNRLLKIELKVPDEIYLYEYFEVGVKIRNISSMSMNLLIEIKENEDNVISDKANNFEYMPAIISQTKFQSLGMFNCNEDKIFSLKFLTTKLGFTHLPNFAITDTLLNRRFYLVQNNKIFIKENPNKNSNVNVLNHLISTTINN